MKLLLIIIVFIIFSFSATNAQTYVLNGGSSNIEIDVDTNKIYPFYMLDKEPIFIGGKDSLQRFIEKNFKLTRKQMEYEGILCVCFTLSRFGEVIDYYIPGETETYLFTPIINNLVKKFPKWSAGEIDGIAVKSIICIPFFIRFK